MTAGPGPLVLVEDNNDDEVLTSRALRRAGVANDIIVAHDGQEAIDLLLGDWEHGRAPALVLLDLKLPKVDGLEVLRRVRADERARLLPIVILTTSDQPSDVLCAYEHGANSFVRKPVDFVDFAESVRQVGRYWLIVNHPPPARTGG